jgi:hypothetical protein
MGLTSPYSGDSCWRRDEMTQNKTHAVEVTHADIHIDMAMRLTRLEKED